MILQGYIHIHRGDLSSPIHLTACFYTFGATVTKAQGQIRNQVHQIIKYLNVWTTIPVALLSTKCSTVAICWNNSDMSNFNLFNNCLVGVQKRRPLNHVLGNLFIHSFIHERKLTILVVLLSGYLDCSSNILSSEHIRFILELVNTS